MYARLHHHVYNRPVVLLRPFNCFGPYQSPRAIIPEIIIKCLRGQTIKSTEGIQTRDFNYVDNLVEGVLMASVTDQAVGKIINIGSGIEVTIKDMILKIHELTGAKSELQIGALPYRPTEIWRMQAANQRAKDILGWESKISWEEGLERTVDWFKKYIKVYHEENSPLLEL